MKQEDFAASVIMKATEDKPRTSLGTMFCLGFSCGAIGMLFLQHAIMWLTNID